MPASKSSKSFAKAFAAFDDEPQPIRRRLRAGETVPVPEFGLPNLMLSGRGVFIDEYSDGTRVAIIPHPAKLTEGLLRLLAFRQDGTLSGPELRFIRHALGLSQEELAGQLGVTRETISRYESGRLGIGAIVAAAVRLRAVMKLLGDLPHRVQKSLCVPPRGGSPPGRKGAAVSMRLSPSMDLRLG